MHIPTLSTQLRLLGTIEAGWPSPAEEELTDTIKVDEWLTDNWEATIMLKVEGNAMIGAGIMPKDMVLLDRSRGAQDGDIVLAEIDDTPALRYFRKRGSLRTTKPTACSPRGFSTLSAGIPPMLRNTLLTSVSLILRGISGRTGHRTSR
jgi:hypothetical protein